MFSSPAGLRREGLSGQAFALALPTGEGENPCYVSLPAGVVLMARDPEPPTGSTLLVLLRDPGDPLAWNAFVRRYGPVIHAWCRGRRLQEADAENVTQDVLTRLVKKLGAFRYDPDRGAFRAWLRTLT